MDETKYLFSPDWDDARRRGIQHEMYIRRYGTWTPDRTSIYTLPETQFSKDSVTYTAMVVEADVIGFVPDGLTGKMFTAEDMESNGYELESTPIE